MGEWKKRGYRWREIVPFTNRELAWATISALVALTLALTFVHFGMNIFGHKQPKKHSEVVQPLPVSVGGFKPKAGYFGTQYYVVSVRPIVHDGKKTFFPLGDCPDFMIVDLTFPVPVRDTNNLHDRLSPVLGVNGGDGVEVHGYKIVIHRPCISVRERPLPPGVHENWDWERVWENVAPVLEAYFNPTQK
jgi:hypothetical protein